LNSAKAKRGVTTTRDGYSFKARASTARAPE